MHNDARRELTEWVRAGDLAIERLRTAELLKEAQVRERREAIDRDIRQATADLELRFSVPAARRLADALITKHDLDVIWTVDRRPCRIVGTRRLYVPPIASVEDLATFLHEAAHVLTPPCRGPRHHEFVQGRMRNCLECEVLATTYAMRHLAPFDKAMQVDLAAALQTYLESTPAPAEVQQAAQRLIAGTVVAGDAASGADARGSGDEAGSDARVGAGGSLWLHITMTVGNTRI